MEYFVVTNDMCEICGTKKTVEKNYYDKYVTYCDKHPEYVVDYSKCNICGDMLCAFIRNKTYYMKYCTMCSPNCPSCSGPPHIGINDNGQPFCQKCLYVYSDTPIKDPGYD